MISSMLSFLLIIFVSSSFGKGIAGDRILVEDIYTLTLYQDEMTTGNRLKIPQFKCIGGSAESENYKIIKSDKLLKKLNYKFHYISPMDYLSEIFT